MDEGTLTALRAMVGLARGASRLMQGTLAPPANLILGVLVNRPVIGFDLSRFLLCKLTVKYINVLGHYISPMTFNAGLAHELVIERILQKLDLVVVTDALRVTLLHHQVLLWLVKLEVVWRW